MIDVYEKRAFIKLLHDYPYSGMSDVEIPSENSKEFFREVWIAFDTIRQHYEEDHK